MKNKITHQQLVKKLVKHGDEILKELSSADVHCIHMVLGICGEAGELLDSIKKTTIYRQPFDIINIIEELGDIEFYLEGLRQCLFLSRKETLDANIKKLSKRYSNLQFSNYQATKRADKQ